jgi:hypothetical protein
MKDFKKHAMTGWIRIGTRLEPSILNVKDEYGTDAGWYIG